MNIDIAVIAPTRHLADLSSHGSIDMALTHLVLARPDYAEHYASRAASGKRVILDNSAFELQDDTGAGMDTTPVLHAAATIGASDVVCTDVLYDGPATLEATRKFTEQATRLLPGIALMGVPHGRTRAEWLACYTTLTAMTDIATIGLSKLSVPRCWGGDVADARLACVAELHRTSPPKPLHLLGGDHSLPHELRRHRMLGHHAVHSNDSSAAVWYAAHGHRFHPGTGRAHQSVTVRPDLDGAVLTEDQQSLARANIAVLRDHAGLEPK